MSARLSGIAAGPSRSCTVRLNNEPWFVKGDHEPDNHEREPDGCGQDPPEVKLMDCANPIEVCP